MSVYVISISENKYQNPISLEPNLDYGVILTSYALCWQILRR